MLLDSFKSISFNDKILFNAHLTVKSNTIIITLICILENSQLAIVFTLILGNISHPVNTTHVWAHTNTHTNSCVVEIMIENGVLQAVPSLPILLTHISLKSAWFTSQKKEGRG